MKKRLTGELWARGSSLIAATTALILLSPILVFIALAVWWDSPGGVIYRQERVGRGGRSFVMLKFRSMCADAERWTGPVWAAARDGRTTGVGRWLRRTHWDELPQLLNVIAGDMNLIGPRPERPVFVETLRQQLPGYERRHWVRPGMTGLAQVRVGYGAGIEGARSKLRYDLGYLRQRSLRLDLWILAQTVRHVARYSLPYADSLFGDGGGGVYRFDAGSSTTGMRRNRAWNR